MSRNEDEPPPAEPAFEAAPQSKPVKSKGAPPARPAPPGACPLAAMSARLSEYWPKRS